MFAQSVFHDLLGIVSMFARDVATTFGDHPWLWLVVAVGVILLLTRGRRR